MLHLNGLTKIKSVGEQMALHIELCVYQTSGSTEWVIFSSTCWNVNTVERWGVFFAKHHLLSATTKLKHFLDLFFASSACISVLLEWTGLHIESQPLNSSTSDLITVDQALVNLTAFPFSACIAEFNKIGCHSRKKYTFLFIHLLFTDSSFPPC